jgi:hypothetical protein
LTIPRAKQAQCNPQSLLQVGRPEPVLEYFQLCAAFWNMGKDQLEQWTKAVHAGQMPAFGTSLVD